jgi:hypothetical protein
LRKKSSGEESDCSVRIITVLVQYAAPWGIKAVTREPGGRSTFLSALYKVFIEELTCCDIIVQIIDKPLGPVCQSCDDVSLFGSFSQTFVSGQIGMDRIASHCDRW